MPVIAAICPSCNEVRAQTVDLPRGTHPRAADFEPLGGQEPPVDGTLATCTTCRTSLVFHVLPPAVTNGAGAAFGVEKPASAVTQQVTSPSSAIRLLFQLDDDEKVRFTRKLGRDRLAIITNRRGFILDLTKIVEEVS